LPIAQVLVRISDLAVIAGEARATGIAEAISWAEARKEALALKWAELNDAAARRRIGRARARTHLTFVRWL